MLCVIEEIRALVLNLSSFLNNFCIYYFSISLKKNCYVLLDMPSLNISLECRIWYLKRNSATVVYTETHFTGFVPGPCFQVKIFLLDNPRWILFQKPDLKI